MQFKVTADHLTLLKRMNVSWDDCEYGAPCIDPKRPYGNSDVERDIIEILGFVDEELERKHAANLHLQMKTVLQILLHNLKIKPGVYELANPYGGKWARI